MATDKKKSADKNSPDSKVPDKKNIEKKILAFVERCENPAELESLIKNATRLGNAAVAEAAFRKRISLVPAEGREGRCRADAARLGRRQSGDGGFQNAAGARHAGVHR
jgi:hypothetical protein